MTLKVFEAFAGIGSQTQALKNIGVDHEVVAISEIDKWAIASYEAIHGKTKNLGDISKLKDEDIPEHDLFTYSFPCQDISLAGERKGLDEGSGTRSSLLWECERVIRAAKPKYLLLENVKNLVSKKHKHNFDKWLKILEGYGYKNYWQVLNAKDYGIPQNRERVFVVSIRNDIDCAFEFPKPMPLVKHLKDMLEDQVDEKFYLSKEMQDKFIYKPTKNPQHNCINVAGELNTPGWHRPAKEVLNTDGISSTIMAQANNGIRKVLIKNGTKKGYLEAEVGDGISLGYANSKNRRGRVQKQITSTLDTTAQQGVLTENYRIRKLTPRECWRLMGFKDEQFDKAQQVCSNSQLYKQAGNSIVVNVLEEIFKGLV